MLDSTINSSTEMKLKLAKFHRLREFTARKLFTRIEFQGIRVILWKVWNLTQKQIDFLVQVPCFKSSKGTPLIRIICTILKTLSFSVLSFFPVSQFFEFPSFFEFDVICRFLSVKHSRSGARDKTKFRIYPTAKRYQGEEKCAREREKKERNGCTLKHGKTLTRARHSHD